MVLKIFEEIAYSLGQQKFVSSHHITYIISGDWSMAFSHFDILIIPIILRRSDNTAKVATTDPNHSL